jgi:hypothetical protein
VVPKYSWEQWAETVKRSGRVELSRGRDFSLEARKFAQQARNAAKFFGFKVRYTTTRPNKVILFSPRKSVEVG